jgi:hypothetical protein
MTAAVFERAARPARHAVAVEIGYDDVIAAAAAKARSTDPPRVQAKLKDPDPAALKAARGDITTEKQVTMIKSVDDVLDAVLMNSAVLRPYIQTRLEQGVAMKGHVQFVDDGKFSKEYYKAYGKKPPADQAGLHELDQVPGFTTPNGEIYLRIDVPHGAGMTIANFGAALHEAIHRLSSPLQMWSKVSFVMEGVTDYFTNLVLHELDLKDNPSTYTSQLEAAHLMVPRALDEKELAKAYFGGGPQMILSTLQGKKLNSLWNYWVQGDVPGLKKELNQSTKDPTKPPK